MDGSGDNLTIEEREHYRMATMKRPLLMLYDAAGLAGRARENILWNLIFVRQWIFFLAIICFFEASHVVQQSWQTSSPSHSPMKALHRAGL
jgi:hypothetical protein